MVTHNKEHVLGRMWYLMKKSYYYAIQIKIALWFGLLIHACSAYIGDARCLWMTANWCDFPFLSALWRCPFRANLVALDSRGSYYTTNSPTCLICALRWLHRSLGAISSFCLRTFRQAKNLLNIIIFVNYSVCRSNLENLSGNGQRNSENGVVEHESPRIRNSPCEMLQWTIV